MKCIWKTHTLHFFPLAAYIFCMLWSADISGLSSSLFAASLIPNLPLALGREENSSKRLECCHRMIFWFFVNVSDIKEDSKPDGCKGILKFNLRKLNSSVGTRFWLEVDKNLSDNYGKNGCPMVLLNYYLLIPSGELPLLESQVAVCCGKAKPKESQ